MKTIPLANCSLVAIVDDDDFEYLSQFKWQIGKQNRLWYARRGLPRKDGKAAISFMHRELLNAPKGMDVDHKDYDGLNNQRSNIRLMSRSQNLQRGRAKITSQSGFKGIYFDRQKNKWQAEIYLGNGGKRIRIGGYDKPELAAFAFNVAAAMLRPVDTYVNKIDIEFDLDSATAIRRRVSEAVNRFRKKF
jgi:hypothetical protein